MWNYRYTDELMHYGVLGMKWGVRRYQEKDGSLTPAGKKRYSISDAIDRRNQKEKAYRNKLTAILKKSGDRMNWTDQKRFEYRNQNLATRVGKTAATVIAGKLAMDALSGGLMKYAYMSKAQIAKELSKIAVSTATNVAINDALAKSASKRYTDDGNYTEAAKRKKTNSLMTREDIAQVAIEAAVQAAPVIAFMGQMASVKYAKAQARSAHNEEVFRSWGSNILSEKVDNIIWTSADGKIDVID